MVLKFWILVLSLSSMNYGYTQAETFDLSECDAYVTHSANEISCYKAIHMLTNWTTAQETCTELGGHVVSVTSAEERRTVLDLMAEEQMDDVWIGALEVPGTWRWYDERNIFHQGCFWDDQTDPDFSEVFLIANNNYNVCERKCMERGFQYGGLQNKDKCWCGDSFGKHGLSLSCSVLCPDQVTVCGGVTANSVFAVHGTHSNWAKGLPNNHFGYQTCAELETGNDFLWNDAKCNEVRGFICQTDDPAFCSIANSTIIQQPNSTICYHINASPLTWFQARYACSQLGGDLAHIDQNYVDDFIVDALVKLDVNGSNYVAGFWFSLTRAPWKWQSGEEFVYTLWSNGEPNGDTQQCATMNSEEGEWEDRGCADIWRTICELDSRLEPSTTVPTTESSSTSEPVPSTTTLRLAPVRDTARDPIYPLEDRFLAAIVAGGVVMFIIIIVSTSIHCYLKCKKRAKKKEEEKDAKREKYFFGFDGADQPSATMPPAPPASDNPPSPGGDSEYSPTQLAHGDFQTYDNISMEEPSKQEVDDSDRKSPENRRSNRLSDKPDLIPDTN